MGWIKAAFSAIGLFFGGVKDWGTVIVELISAIKLLFGWISDQKEQGRRNDLDEGIKEGDTKKIEDSFDSPIAGKPSGNNTDVWDD